MNIGQYIKTFTFNLRCLHSESMLCYGSWSIPTCQISYMNYFIITQIKDRIIMMQYISPQIKNNKK